MSPYEVLGVGPNASDREIRRAYRRLALQHHPDRSDDSSAASHYEELHAAYETLLGEPPPESVSCSMCDGHGQIISRWSETIGGQWLRCPNCMGTGKTFAAMSEQPPTAREAEEAERARVRREVYEGLAPQAHEDDVEQAEPARHPSARQVGERVLTDRAAAEQARQVQADDESKDREPPRRPPRARSQQEPLPSPRRKRRRLTAVAALVALAVPVLAVGVLVVFVLPSLLSESASRARERDAAIAGRNVAIQERNEAIDAHNAAIRGLDSARAEKTALDAEYTELEARYAGTLDDLAALRVEHETQQVDMATLRADHDALTDDLRAVTLERDEARGRQAELETEMAEMQSSMSTMQSDTDTMRDDMDVLKRINERLEGRMESLSLELETAQKQRSEALTRARSLEGRVGSMDSLRLTIDRLSEQKQDLEAEIEELKVRREPLLLEPGGTMTVWFKCTGSMEPKITCLDKATVITDIRPADIVVGTVLMFKCRRGTVPGDDPGEFDWGAAHRVIEVRVVNGVHYYLPKGDASDSEDPDPCWVHEDGVDGYLTALHKNVRMENAALRDAVLDARDAFRASTQAYRDVRQRVCGAPDATVCPAGPQYAAVTAAYDRHIEAYHTYNCWLNHAREAEYGASLPHDCS